jgi:metal-dependent amidase/aminoacylase/carboxypeptidase family protein
MLAISKPRFEPTFHLAEMYKDIHQNPELGFMETRTAGIVAKELKGLGFEVQTGIGKTGIGGILRNGPGPTVMYRADMDANAVEEITGLPYASKVRIRREDGNETSMGHMCGHDAHVTWMLGMAKAMATMKRDWSGTLVLMRIEVLPEPLRPEEHQHLTSCHLQT